MSLQQFVSEIALAEAGESAEAVARQAGDEIARAGAAYDRPGIARGPGERVEHTAHRPLVAMIWSGNNRQVGPREDFRSHVERRENMRVGEGGEARQVAVLPDTPEAEADALTGIASNGLAAALASIGVASSTQPSVATTRASSPAQGPRARPVMRHQQRGERHREQLRHAARCA